MEDNWFSQFKSGYRKGISFTLRELKDILERERFNQKEMHAFLSAALDDLEMFLSYGSACSLFLKKDGKSITGKLYEPGTIMQDIKQAGKNKTEVGQWQ